VNLTKLIDQHKKAGAIISMGLKSVPIEEVVHLGVVVTDQNGKITEFQEKPPIEEAKSTMVNTGIYIFEAELFNYIPADTFYDFAKQVFPAVMKDNKGIYGFEIEGYWNDIGTFLQYRITSQDVLAGKTTIDIPGQKSSNKIEGSNNRIANNVKFEGMSLIGDNCTIEEDTILKDNASIGNNCIIGKKVTLDGCVIWDNVRIGDNSTLNNCLIGNNVNISQNVTINTDAVIADNCIIKEGANIEAETKIKQNEIFA
ncbi:MAG: sugar phosphate nucleotidyltransferase, partial [Vampirovibrionia bacterium]